MNPHGEARMGTGAEQAEAAAVALMTLPAREVPE